MPIYDFNCNDCGHSFEELAAFDAQPHCNSCGSEHTQRQFSFGGNADAAEREVEAEPEQILAESHGEDLLQTQATLRAQDERAWDLERDFERRHSVQLTEIAEKSARVSELMSQIEALEPLLSRNNELTRQLAEVCDARQVLEGTERAQAAALEQRAVELETAGREAQDLRMQLTEATTAARAQQEHAGEQIEERDNRIESLCGQIKEVQQDLETRTAALFKRDEMVLAADQELADLREELREQDRELTAANEALTELKSELASADTALRERQESGGELKQVLATVELELQAVRDQLNTTSATLNSSQKQKDEFEDALASAKGEVEHHRAKCRASARHLTATQSVIEELAPMLRSLETTLGSGHPADAS